MNYLHFFLFWFGMMMLMFFLVKHPLIMGLLLIMSTFFLSIFSSLYSFSSWNGYILFLMFLGGILILFLYNISLISTEIFSYFKLNMYFFLLFFLLSMLFIFKLKEGLSNEMMTFLYEKKNTPMMCFYFLYNFNTILFLMSYLFLSLICVINLIYFVKDKGSMRKLLK